MTSAAVALGNRYLFKTPYVLHIQDLWPESVIDSGMVSAGWKGKALHALIGFGLRPIYRGAKHIIVISSGMKDALIERGVDASKISVVLNWDGNENPDPAGISTSSIIERTAESAIAGIHCIYAGNIGQMQDVETIVRAASLVENEFPIRISIYGSGVAESAISSLIKDLGLKSVQLMGRVSQDKMAEIYDQADFLFVTLKDRPVFRMTIPSKFQASMANGVPVITTVQGDLAEICIDSGVGFVANAEDPRSLADVLRKANALDSEARARMSLRAEQYYRDEMSAELALGRVACVLESASKR
ncbi:glycosyltransferase involved in cell wall biosynthesis [Arthrobacter bambusae]|uniref:Glycosyltransferase involved in cell wall biosynthesis n=2 Tax=Arthrobacter bambusae TaxID=1338426 RepID=A0AAW8DHB4_9MICC|nr:glycosyltransferase involved in cell wall biosynthesis [Arthrobacter bambusae]MDQ0129460.1 glycosyltransferase involved in cell wall biosynthesis [Arthrobacter bambusae]MDQ0180927.1 glycosyltransferase involved in cell wall biosynthesis [Arthrobacter bambusae]